MLHDRLSIVRKICSVPHESCQRRRRRPDDRVGVFAGARADRAGVRAGSERRSREGPVGGGHGFRRRQAGDRGGALREVSVVRRERGWSPPLSSRPRASAAPASPTSAACSTRRCSCCGYDPQRVSSPPDQDQADLRLRRGAAARQPRARAPLRRRAAASSAGRSRQRASGQCDRQPAPTWQFAVIAGANEQPAHGPADERQTAGPVDPVVGVPADQLRLHADLGERAELPHPPRSVSRCPNGSRLRLPLFTDPAAIPHEAGRAAADTSSRN